MRKTNLNLKRVKFFKRLAVFMAVQAILIVLFVGIDCDIADDFIDENDLKESVVVVEKTTYDYLFAVGRVFSFFADGAEYCFPKYPIIRTIEYSMHDLRQVIGVGDELVVQYLEKPTGYEVIGAKKGDVVLRSVESYDHYIREQHTLTIVAFVVVETVFVAVLVFFVLFYWNEVKLFSRKKKNRNA